MVAINSINDTVFNSDMMNDSSTVLVQLFSSEEFSSAVVYLLTALCVLFWAMLVKGIRSLFARYTVVPGMPDFPAGYLRRRSYSQDLGGVLPGAQSQDLGGVLPGAQSLNNATLFAALTYFMCVMRHVKRKQKIDKTLLALEGALFLSALSADPIISNTILTSDIFDILRDPAAACSGPQSQSFEITNYMKKVVVLIGGVIGLLIAHLTGSKFSFGDFAKSDFASLFSISSSTNMFKLFMEIVTTLSGRVNYFRATNDVGGFFADGFKNWELMSEVNAMLANENLIKASNYKLAGFKSSHDCILALSKLVKKCKTASLHMSTNTSITHGSVKLKALLNHVMARSQGSSLREQPFGVLIYGKSGMLKSILTDLIVKQLLCVMGLPSSKDYIGRMNLEEEFQSTYEPQFTAVILDDLANTKAEMSGVVLSQKIIEIINNSPVCTNQADLDRKGVVWYRPHLVVASTNVPNLQAPSYSNQPDAVLRRFIHIHIDDVVRAADPSDVFANNWSGQIIDYFTRGRSGDYKPCVHKLADGSNVFTTTKQLVDELSIMCKEHVVVQQGVVEGSLNLYAEEPCEHGSLKQFCNTCSSDAKSQSGSFHYFTLYLLMLLHTFTELYCVIPYIRIFNAVRFTIWGRPVSAYAIFASVKVGLSFLVGFSFGLPGYALTFTTYAVARGMCWVMSVANLEARVRHFDWRPRERHSFALLVGGLSLVAGLTYMYYSSAANEKNNTPAGDAQGDGIWNDKENVWKTSGFTTRPVCFSADQKCQTHDDLVSRMSSATMRIRHGSRTSMMTYVANGYWVVNKHFIDRIPEGDEIIFCRPGKGKFSETKLPFTCGLVQEIVDCDLMLMCPNVGRGKDISKWLPATMDVLSNVNLPMRATLCQLNGGDVAVSNMRYMRELTFSDSALGVINVRHIVGGDGHTASGMCGLPYVVNSTKGTLVAGFHSAGDTDGHCYGSVLTLKMFNMARKRYETTHTGTFSQSDCDQVVFFDPETGLNRKLVIVEPHYKSSVIHSPGGGSMDYCGKVEGLPLAKPKSKVQPSLITAAITSIFGVENVHGPPGGGGPMSDPSNYQRHFDAVGDISPGFCTEVLDAASDDLMDQFNTAPEIKDNAFRLGVLPDGAEINGQPGRWGVDRVNMSTSGGFMCNGAKSKLFVPADDGTDNVRPIPGLQLAIDKTLDVYKSGQSCGPIFSCNLKDEPTKLTKKKVRVFAGAPIVFSLLVRKYLLSFCSLFTFHETRLVFEAAVGINCYGEQWLDAYRHIVKHGEHNVVAGDYAAFDQNMHARVTQRALGIIIEFVKFSNKYNEEDLVVIRGLLTDIQYPYYCSNGELFCVSGSNPSGNNLTTIINCLVNSLYVRCVYFKEASRLCAAALESERSVSPFRDVVSLLTYGDDNIMSVSDKVNSWFNHTTLERGFAEVGIGYTMADKTSASVPLINIRGADFLKRSFEEAGVRVTMVDGNEFLQNVVFCPLSVTSLYKTLHNYRGGELDLHDDSVVAIDTVLREAFHHGKTFYEDFVVKSHEVVTVCELTPLRKFISYDEALLQWYKAGWTDEPDNVLSVHLA